MTTEIELSEKEKRSPDYWIDPYPKKHPKELQAFATFVHEGKGWRTSPTGQRYCIGPVDKLKNGVPTNNTDSPQTISLSVKEPVAKVSEGKTTNTKILKANKDTFATKIGRPKREVPEDFIKQLSNDGKTVREIALLVDIEKGVRVHYSTIQRILSGQKVLV